MINYKEYAVWDESNIKGFFDQYRFLSNFHMCDVYFGGMLFPSSEHAYMSVKTQDTTIKEKFTKRVQIQLTCSEARKLGQKITLKPNWEQIKYDVMLAIVFDKFWRNRDIRDKLIETNNKYLEETNSWGDEYWGVNYKTGIGANNLGKILMKVRECLR